MRRLRYTLGHILQAKLFLMRLHIITTQIILFLVLLREMIAKTLLHNVYGQDWGELEHLPQFVRLYLLRLQEIMQKIYGNEMCQRRIMARQPIG